MQRRQFLFSGACGALVSCAPSGGGRARPAEPARPEPSPPQARAPIRGICFDLFTLFDPRSVVEAARSVAGERAPALCEAWRVRQFEYAPLRVAAGKYVDFRVVTGDALDYAARTHRLRLEPAQREDLIDAYSRLEPWPDARATLLDFRRAGLRLTPLANYSPRMLSQLLAHARFADLFDAQISTDAARTFKPDPRAYALGVSTLGLPREQIVFAAFGGWDAAGAKWFGYPTFWVNRLNVPREALAPGFDGTGPTLLELADFVRGWA